jgi:hypothetical protein
MLYFHAKVKKRTAFRRREKATTRIPEVEKEKWVMSLRI